MVLHRAYANPEPASNFLVCLPLLEAAKDFDFPGCQSAVMKLLAPGLPDEGCGDSWGAGHLTGRDTSNDPEQGLVVIVIPKVPADSSLAAMLGDGLGILQPHHDDAGRWPSAEHRLSCLEAVGAWHIKDYDVGAVKCRVGPRWHENSKLIGACQAALYGFPTDANWAEHG